MALPNFLTDLDPNIYFSDNYVVVDVETDTSHGDYGHAVHPDNRLLLACWRHGAAHIYGGEGRYTHSSWGDELSHAELIRDLASADFVVAHHAKYELGWFIRMGIDIHKVLVFDTMIGEYVLLGNLAAGSDELGMLPRSISLDECCKRRGFPPKDPVVDIMIKDGLNPVFIPQPWLEGRCRRDVETTENLFLSQRAELKRRGLLPVQFTRCLLTPVLADIEREGIALDGPGVEAEYEKYATQAAELTVKMDEITGGINPRSIPQVAKFLYSAEGLGFKELCDRRGVPKRNGPTKQFPLGAPKTDNKTLEKLEVTTKRQRQFMALRGELNKAMSMLSKNLDFFLGVVKHYDGIFYGEINQCRTATHRTASAGMPVVIEEEERRVQFQNFPRILKKLIKAKREGWMLIEPDGSQIEFRCAAVLGADERAIADINNPEFDAHVQTAMVLHDCSKEEVYDEKKASSAAGKDDWRQLAKPDTYKPLYGGKFGTPEQERYYKWFREHYSGIAKAQDSWVNEALETKRLRTPWGLVYHWPTARRDGRGRVNVESAVDNYPVQALATAEIIPIAVVYLWQRIHEAGLSDRIRLINMVHDSVPTEVHPDAVREFTGLVKQSFTHDVYGYLKTVYGFDWDARVPLGVGLKVGDRWGQGKEQSYDIYMDGTEVRKK